jgi:nitrogen fixation/metabolism regulation signal transduction histidine kinase
LHTYHAVIQQLKQQKHELQSLQLLERRRAKTSETVSAAVLSNLSSGVLFFTPNGLVRQANASAKQILGFASPAGMSAGQIFREAELISVADGAYANLADAVSVSLREKTRFQRLEARYRTPAGQERTLDITVSSVHAPDSEVLGAACLINDRTEMTEIRRQQELRGEMSAEMALGLRNSLTTISGYAQQLAASRDPELARQLASDIAAEAAHLDRTIGGFLAGAKAARAGSKA